MAVKRDGNKKITDAAVSMAPTNASAENKKDLSEVCANAEDVAAKKTSFKERMKHIGESAKNGFDKFKTNIFTPAKNSAVEWGKSVGSSFALAYNAYQTQRLRDKDAKLQSRIEKVDNYVAEHSGKNREAVVAEKAEPEQQVVAETKSAIKVRPYKVNRPEASHDTEPKAMEETAIGKDIIKAKQDAMGSSEKDNKAMYIKSIYKALISAKDQLSEDKLKQIYNDIQSPNNSTVQESSKSQAQNKHSDIAASIVVDEKDAGEEYDEVCSI